ncbi:MAG: Glutamine-dependent synthetase [Verrucomicrobiota bacterium]|jgi:NAD+ synthase (glutamine-hydrolysing)
MRQIRCALATPNQTPLDWDGNEARIRAAMDAARAGGASLLLLPEMALCGYGCDDVFLAPHLYDTALAAIENLARHSQGLLTVVGMPLIADGQRRSAAAILHEGRIAGFHLKRHLANDGLHYEPRWFCGWPAGELSSVALADGSLVPCGDLGIEIDGLRIGFEICEDAWVAERRRGRIARLAPDLVLNPSASHFAFHKQAKRRELVRQGSELFSCAYLYANLLGNEAGRSIYDGGCFAARDGFPLFESSRFSLREVEIHLLDLDLPEKSRSPQEGLLPLSGKLGAPSTALPPRAAAPSWAEDEEFLLAETLGLWDFMRKSRSRGFVLSLSGGVDSAVCAVLVRLMAERLWRELGTEGLGRALAWWPEAATCRSLEEMMPKLLITAYQGTANSGEVTRGAAAAVAATCASEHREYELQAVLEAYHAFAADTLGRPLRWDSDDIALQNIQARIRAPSVWMLANLRNALLITTSNRSEAAVGYATMDGDTAGSLGPIGGVGKTFLRAWLNRLEFEKLAGFGPFPALGLVNRQAPTAELRPPERSQTDEADLMPYEVLDAIEKAAVLERLPPKAILPRLARDFGDRWEESRLRAWLKRFYALWCRNQWKRERYAPSFHIDDENLDPRSWCRFPILSGGFARELAELDQIPP